MLIEIRDELQDSEAMLGVVTAKVVVRPSPRELLDVLQDTKTKVRDSENISRSTATTKEILRRFGWDVNRYRISAEALFRRVVKGRDLHSICNVIDINNIVSLETGWCVGSYDMQLLSVPIEFRVGRPGESYASLGNTTLQVEGLPVLSDSVGAFGSLVKDSDRAPIRMETREVMMVVAMFGQEARAQAVERAAEMLKEHAEATDVVVEVGSRGNQ